MNNHGPAREPNPREAARSWYTTAATAGAVAVLALITGIDNAPTWVAGILLAAAAVVAVTEGRRRSRRLGPSRLGATMMAALTVAAALLGLLGLATGGLLR